MPTPIEETTSELIERARTLVEKLQRGAKTDVQIAAVVTVFGGGLTGAFAAGGATWAAGSGNGAVALGFVLAAALIVFGMLNNYFSRSRLADDYDSIVARLEWIETQARDGLLNDAEVRTELLRLLR